MKSGDRAPDPVSVYAAFGKNAGDLLRLILEKTGGLSRFVSPGDAVLLKPNVLNDRGSATGATTDPLLVDALLSCLRDSGVRRITLAESAWVGADTPACFDKCGYTALAKKHGVPLVDLKRDRFSPVDVPVPDSVLRTVKVARTALDAEKIINLPVLKAHCQARLTCGMKNLMGVIPDSEKRRFHTVDLDRAVFELNTVLRPALNICDAVIGDLTFEEGGTPVEFGRVFMAADICAFDCHAAAVLGYEPDEIGYLRHYRRFFGNSGPFRVSRLNEQQTDERFPARDYRSRYACRFNVQNACCSCLASVFTALEADKKASSGLTFHVGKGAGGAGVNNGGLHVFVGRCTQPFSGGGVHVPGCPPDGNAVRRALRLKS